MAYRYQPLFAHAFRGRISTSSTGEELRTFFRDLLATTDNFVLQRGAAALAGYELEFPKGLATHLVYKEVRFHDLLDVLLGLLPDLHLVALIRDPRDVIASWVAAPREFRPEWSVEDEWFEASSKNAGLGENWYGFARWMELARLFLVLEEKYPGRVSLIRYEDLVASTEQILTRLFHVVNLPVTAQVRSFIDRSISEDDGAPYGVLRNRRRRSVPPLDERISARIERELAGDPLAQFLSRGGR